MIFFFLLLTRFPNIAVTDDYPDFFAVKKSENGRDHGYKVFRRVGDCAVYISGDQRLLFQVQGEEKWEIANLLGYYTQDCQNILKSVRVIHDFPEVALKGQTNISIKRKKLFHSSYRIMSLPICEEIKGLMLSADCAVFNYTE